ncbi:D-galacturonic acid reductase [Raphidocelis subcapitata]|uniref:D-galacturonic acid reductase n=1 Tax=Raphidocelis subcapitata TaxID=307507 RepID=A0A2V0PC70_9CHLO|nr:D-galacturonic acid reductase [Raphidocelis subcapitata]|eukprot:GBF95493.1 D-galacturonic acid reductase [Raphidocelis subcapitata]
MGARRPVNVLMIGAGEYTAGFVQTAHGAATDKPAGVVALTCFDLRRSGLVGRMVLCDRCGTRMPAVRATIEAKIGSVYAGLDTALECFPADDVPDDADAYKKALATMSPGDAAIIFTPDDSHFQIAAACLAAGLHTLVAKPLVRTLEHHRALIEAAEDAGVMLAVEYHKRFDPIYSDARNRARSLGPFSYFYSYMAQPKVQLETFRGWAGRSSDINYYLNSHHIDIHNWMAGHAARPERVVALAAAGVAEGMLGRPCEDTITLSVQWRALEGGAVGTAVYTASWIAPKAECHTRQHFHYMGQTGELHADQAHRGYSGATDAAGYAAINPLYMRYVPDANGRFAGQTGYGYISIAKFLETARDLRDGPLSLASVRREGQLALAQDTLAVTAILEAGRASLDAGGAPVEIEYDGAGAPAAVRVAGGAGGAAAGAAKKKGAPALVAA